MKKKLIATLCLFLPLMAGWNGFLYAQQDSSKRPVVIASDWDKAPYEFRNDKGEPAGYYVDVLTTILDDLDIPYQFQMMEASKATDLFERGDADLFFDNVRKYSSSEYVHTSNIISYYRISVATAKDSANIIPLKTLDNPEAVVFYHGGYAAHFFKREIPEHQALNYQPPKEALAGIVKGRYKYFVWNEAALQWKIKELNLENDITLHEVNIPVGEIHIIGRDQSLIEAIDDKYSRMKQRGEIEKIHDKWFHPEHKHDDTSPMPSSSHSRDTSASATATSITGFTSSAKTREQVCPKTSRRSSSNASSSSTNLSKVQAWDSPSAKPSPNAWEGKSVWTAKVSAKVPRSGYGFPASVVSLLTNPHRQHLHINL